MYEYPYIKFDGEFKEPILSGLKYMTVRYDWDIDIVAGDVVDLVDADGNRFAEAVVTVVTTLTIEQFVEQKYAGHKKYGSAKEMCSALGHFYDDEITPETEVTLIMFRVHEDCMKNGDEEDNYIR